MKLRSKPVIAAISLACLGIGQDVYAQDVPDKMQVVKNEIDQLQVQLNLLKTKISASRSSSNQTKSKLSSQKHLAQNSRAGSRSDLQTFGPVKPIGSFTPTPLSTPQSDATPVPDDRPQPVAPYSHKELIRLFLKEKRFMPFDLDAPGESFVTTGPYVGVPVQYSGSDLIINSPSVDTDVQLLNIRQNIYKELVNIGGTFFTEPFHSHLLLSGVVQAQLGYINIGGAPSRSDIDVTNSSFDLFFMGPSRWLLGFIEFTFENSLPLNTFFRVSNSRVLINKAFITIGDFCQSPIYGSIGQFYVPFGRYSSLMISDSLPKLLARTKARALELGIYFPGDNAFYGSTYIFRGDSHAASVSKINNGGINLGYRFKTDFVSGNVGGGVIANLADSGGMQFGNGFTFYEQLVHRVPAYNLRALLDFGAHLDLILEWVGASTRFNPNDMSYNGHGAKPWAFDSQLAYSFFILNDRPSAIGIGYGHSSQALSLGIPMSRLSAVFNTSLWRNTLQSLEFRHDTNYAASSTGNGPTGAQPTLGSCTSATCTASGKSDNAITASFDYYF